MKPTRYCLRLVIIVWLSFSQAWACTVFMAANKQQVLAAANEDWSSPFTIMWLEPASGNNKYGVVYFGFSDRQVQAAMNENGLFYDYAAIPASANANQLRKPQYADDVMKRVVQQYATVNEALQFIRQYRIMFTSAQVLLADRIGNAAIINADTIILKAKPYLAMTNFNVCAPQKGGFPCDRYAITEKMLQENSVSVDTFRYILTATHQEGAYPTQYSNIYDLKTGEVYIHHFHNFQNQYKLNLKAALQKGAYTVNLRDLFPPLFAEVQYRNSHKMPIESIIVQTVDSIGLQAAIDTFYRLKREKLDQYDFDRAQLNRAANAFILRVWKERFPNEAIDWERIWTSDDPRVQDAWALYELIAKEIPHYRTYDSLAYGYMVLGRKQEAIKYYEKSLALNPASEQGKRMLAKLR